MRAGVAAGHPATAAVGAEILADGGTAADAVVAMALASCVAETVMSGLLAGCHAIAFDGTRVVNLDGFAAVPAASGDLVELEIPFGDEPVVYAIGAASCAVPGLPAALGELWERLGRLPWARLCEPALALARSGVSLPEMHATLARDARRAATRSSVALRSTPATAALSPRARPSTSPGSSMTLEALDGGGRGEHVPRVAGGGAPGGRRRRTRSRRSRLVPSALARRRRSSSTRDDASRLAAGSPVSLSCSLACPTLRALTAGERVLALVDRLRADAVGRRAHDEHGRRRRSRPGVRAHALARRRRRACGSPASTSQLNNLLGESDIAHGEPAAGRPSREPYGADARVRRERSRAGDRRSRRDPPADGTRDRARGDPRRGPRCGDRRGSSAGPPHLRAVDAEPGVDETALTSSRKADAPSAAGIGSITTSAASPASGARAPRATHAGAERRYFSSSLSIRREERYRPIRPIARR